MSDFVSGFISIVGRPNVGKSTFLNAALGQKIAIMSEKPQTTRNKIKGILTSEHSQIIFIDTPGIHKPKHELGKVLTDMAYQAIRGVDAIIFMVSANEELGTGDIMIMDRLKKSNLPVYLVINKIDLVKSKLEIDRAILSYLNHMEFAGIFPISALANQNIDKLIEEIKKILPKGPQFYPSDQTSDHPEKFIIAELIREKVLRYTKEEVPHSVAVVVEGISESKEVENLIEVFAVIYVERTSQKGILIGAQGAMLKKIGTSARKDIKDLLGSKVHLETWVKVKKDWRNKKGDLRSLGYNLDNF